MKTRLDSVTGLDAKAPRREDASGLPPTSQFLTLWQKRTGTRGFRRGQWSADIPVGQSEATRPWRQVCRRSGLVASWGLVALALKICRTARSAALVLGLILGGAEVRSELVPIPLESQRAGNQLVLSWTNAAFSLQCAPSVHGVFTNVPGAASPYTNALSGAPAYFRLLGIEAPAGMALIPAGSFTMGNCMDPEEGSTVELPLHTVYLSAFYMDRTEVTKALWNEVRAWGAAAGYTDLPAGYGKATNHPVCNITWFDAVKWCNARSQREGLTPCYYMDAGLTSVYRAGWVEPEVNWTADGYRLPTEAEWEKAARGGASGRRFPWADTDDITHERANYEVWRAYGTNVYAYDTSQTGGTHPTFATGGEPYTSPAGYFAANGYGLYDMAGNVLEWCWDRYEWGSNYYETSPPADPRGPDTGAYRDLRGGSWWDDAYAARCAGRYASSPGYTYYTMGLRCVRGR